MFQTFMHQVVNSMKWMDLHRKVMLLSPTPMGVGVSVKYKNVLCYELHEIYRSTQKEHVSIPLPPSGWGQVPKVAFL